MINKKNFEIVFYLKTKAQPVTAKRKIARAIILFPLALPFFSVDLKGISAILQKLIISMIIYHFFMIIN